MTDLWKRGRRALATCLLAYLGLVPGSIVAQDGDLEKSNVVVIREAANRNLDRRLEVKVVADGTSSRQQRATSVEELPWNEMNPGAREKTREILEDLSLFRRLPTVALESDRRTYDFFVDHPDVAVALWRAMGISRVQLREAGMLCYETDTCDGTTGTIEVLHRTPSSCLILCKGQFQSPALSRPIQADALMHLQPEFKENDLIVHRFDLFVSFPSQTVETIAKVISPISNRIADRNFEEVSLFVEMMNRGMALQPGWVEQVAQKLEGVSPNRPDELLELTAAIYVEANRRQQPGSGSVLVPLPPVSQATAME